MNDKHLPLSVHCRDLSETSITSLPNGGLHELEILKIVDTFSLKVFPSVYNFRQIKEAHLTYPYHCCAFRFPATHNPQEYAKYQRRSKDIEEFCRKIRLEANKPSEESHFRRKRSFFDVSAISSKFLLFDSVYL